MHESTSQAVPQTQKHPVVGFEVDDRLGGAKAAWWVGDITCKSFAAALNTSGLHRRLHAPISVITSHAIVVVCLLFLNMLAMVIAWVYPIK